MAELIYGQKKLIQTFRDTNSISQKNSQDSQKVKDFNFKVILEFCLLPFAFYLLLFALFHEKPHNVFNIC